MKTAILLLVLAVPSLVAQIPVTDVANLTANQAAHSATLAKWIESIGNLRTQIDQLNRQISIQGDIRRWTGSPSDAGSSLVLDGLSASELAREYGRTKRAMVGLSDSLDSLGNTAEGKYRAVTNLNFDGSEMQHDSLIYRRYTVLDAKQAVSVEVSTETRQRELDLQVQVAETLAALKAAATDAEVQKLSVKLAALNGQLSQVEATRRREVDEVSMQKIANDSRLEQERLAAAELSAKDDFLANQRVTAYMRNLKVRRHETN